MFVVSVTKRTHCFKSSYSCLSAGVHICYACYKKGCFNKAIKVMNFKILRLLYTLHIGSMYCICFAVKYRLLIGSYIVIQYNILPLISVRVPVMS
jgi:hypothetical protein